MSTTPTDRFPGPLLSQHDDAAEARAAQVARGADYVVTPGVDKAYGVRRLGELIEALGAPMKPMKALIVGMTTGDLKERLAMAGLECYPDCAGNTVIRTIEAGDAHRALVRAEKQARLDSARRHAELVRQEAERNRANGYITPTPVPR